MRDFSLYEMDLAETDLVEVLDRAPHSVAHGPFPGLLRSRRQELVCRDPTNEKLAAIEEYTKTPNPDAVLIFIADHISIPATFGRWK